jgi:hypothetical protein
MSTALNTATSDSRIVDGFTSLSTESSSEEIAARYDIGIHSKRIDVLEHVKIGAPVGDRGSEHARRSRPTD